MHEKKTAVKHMGKIKPRSKRGTGRLLVGKRLEWVNHNESWTTVSMWWAGREDVLVPHSIQPIKSAWLANTLQKAQIIFSVLTLIRIHSFIHFLNRISRSAVSRRMKHPCWQEERGEVHRGQRETDSHSHLYGHRPGFELFDIVSILFIFYYCLMFSSFHQVLLY